MPEADFTIVRGDTASGIADTLLDDQGDPVNIHKATVLFRLRELASDTVLVQAGAQNNQNGDGADGSKGLVSFSWTQTSPEGEETDEAGWYRGQWVVTWANGRIQTFPSDRYLLVEITDSPALEHAYISRDELKAILELSRESFANVSIDIAIRAASRAIDDACGRRFWKDEDDEQERFYTATSADYLRIDDLVELNEVATDANLDGTFTSLWAEDTDFHLEPLNASADGKPWTALRRRSGGSYAFSTTYPRTIRVTGRFGWPAVPDGVRTFAAILATKTLLRLREAPFGIVTDGAEGIAMRLARTDPDAPTLIGPYTRQKPLLR